jgi:glycosyltransferase involved in cell wall biosynthesis
MNQPLPKVSVIIPCYNLGQYIDEAVDSVLAQTYRDFEIIIVNDGSTDEETINILRNYNKPKTKVIHTDNKGVSAARNTGITAATGLYILALDADDKIDNTYLEKATSILDKKENVGIVYCEAELFGKRTGKWEIPDYKLPWILLRNLIFSVGVFRKKDWERTNGYNTNMIHGWEDYDFWLSIIELGREVVRIPELLYFYRQRPGSRDKLSRKQIIQCYSQIFRNHQQLYVDNIEAVFEHIVDLRANVWQLEDQLEETKIEATLNSFNLREINLVVFPDWCQPEESLSLELEKLIRIILKHPEKDNITLLVDTSNIPDDSDFDVNLVLSSIVMNLLLQENLEITNEPEITLVGNLSEIEKQLIHFKQAFAATRQMLNCTFI